MIPRIIIQTAKEYPVDQQSLTFQKNFREFNSDFEFMFFDDTAVETFMKEKWQSAYDDYARLPIPIMKIDLFRLCAVYTYGGFYFDMDVDCLQSLEPLCSNTLIFAVEEELSNYNFKKELEWGRFKHLQTIPSNTTMKRYANYAFAAERHNPFILQLINGFVSDTDNIIDAYHHSDEEYEAFVYGHSTDRGTVAIYNNKPADLFELLPPNHSIRCSTTVKYPLWFGGYAVHWCAGSWKKNKKQ